MGGTYWLGAALAVLSGVLFNVGSLIQKVAVMGDGGGAGMMRRLVRKPEWIAGFFVQIVLGSPLNMLALAMIGPVIIPGLSSVGLAVLAIGAVRYAGEKLRVGELIGIGLIIAAVTVFGWSGMSVNMQQMGVYTKAFLLRLSVFTVAVAMLSAVCHALQRRCPRDRGILRTLNAGFLFAQSSLWLGVLTELLRQWIADRFALTHFPYILIGSAIVATTSMLGIAETQRAFAAGDVSKLIPIQNVPSQILPIAAYYTVFALRPSEPRSLPLCLLGVALVFTGAVLLAGRQEIPAKAQENTPQING